MLYVHRAERADGLVRALGDLFANPAADPFAPEVVCVPTRGMERWLTQRLSDRLGVCANVEFPSPHRLVTDAMAAASGVEPDRDPWRAERLVWPLLELVEAGGGEPWAHILGRRQQRLRSVRHVADLLDRYALHRPEMVRGWLDGQGDSWQAELWRRVREKIGVASPAERLVTASARLREAPEVVQLPPRLAVFGLTRIPAGHLQVLDALAAARDVHLMLLHPSPALWEKVARHDRVIRRRADPTADEPANRLLASWGQDAREMQLVLAATNARDIHEPVCHPEPGRLLERLQAQVRADEQPSEQALLAPDDRSVEVHACHGRARQVEVLRDAVLHLLADDPTLEPRDVIVMCPDIETFAPLIQATFGVGDVRPEEDLPGVPGQIDLRVRLADRALRQTNPVLGAVAQLLDLAGGRMTASQVLDFADREPVRRRFRLDDDDLTRLQDWIAGSGIRWGLDAEHRAPFKLAALDSGTWRAGLDRVLVGVAMTEDEHRLLHGVLPLDDVESGAIDLAGRFAELVARIEEAVDALTRPMPIAEWVQRIADAADSLTATPEREGWRRAELGRILDDLTTEAAGSPVPLALTDVRDLLADRLRGRPTRANFRTGHTTICTLVPMRSVPHRVVCLLGLDDGVFPRKAPRDGDDLMLDDPHVGDRDPRLEDRQLLLDALLAARDKLIVTYTGNDERTNASQPPAVPVGELLDAVDATVRTPDGTRARERVVVRHPLQPFDPRNFNAGDPWSFDETTLGGARALVNPRSEPPPFLTAPLPAPTDVVLELEDLVRFGQHPVRAFLRRRLGIRLGDFTDEVEDDLRVELDGLQQWQVGQRLLEARLAGTGVKTAGRAEIARGSLPPDHLAEPILNDVLALADLIATEATGAMPAGASPESVDVRLELPDGRLLSGTVADVHGDVLRLVTFSRVAPKHRIATWVRLLALAASHPDRGFSAVTVGRAGKAGVTAVRIPPLDPDEAATHLATFIDLHDRGMREPLPLFCATSAAYVDALRTGNNAGKAARGEWETTWNRDKEDAEPEHQLVLGGVLALEEVLGFAPRPDEQGPGWDPAEFTRFGRLARRMWDPLLAAEGDGR